MKAKKLFVVCLICSFQITTANAALDSVLDGMYANATGPDVTSSQFGGTLSGGSLYIRSPITNLQVFSMDPPRFSAGCGGIDLYLGSFSFISAAKLTQFLRSIAQNAAPLLFKMAVTSLFPNLSAAVDKFQAIAQDMNSSQLNSCKLATGMVDALKLNPAGALDDLSKNITHGWEVLKGWKENFTDAVDTAVSRPSAGVARANGAVMPDGRKEVQELGNLTWNAMKSKTFAGELLNLGDSEYISMEIVQSILGTEVRKQGTTPESETENPPFLPLLRVSQLVNPDIDANGTRSIPVWKCDSEPNQCQAPIKSAMASYGIKGYVMRNMMGAPDATAPQVGSIIYQLTNCTSANCGLSASQFHFLNAVGSVPVVAIMMRAQKNPRVLGIIVPRLVDEMVDEVSLLYVNGLINVVSTIFSETKTPPPKTFDAAFANLLDDQRYLQEKASTGIEKLNANMQFIDSSNRSLNLSLGYRPR